MKYVLRKNEGDGNFGYVAPGGQREEFLSDPRKARIYTDIVQAQLCCGASEVVVPRSIEIAEYEHALKNANKK